MFREEFLSKLCDEMDEHTYNKVSNILDTMLPKFSILEIVDSSFEYNGAPNEVTEFISCKKTEGCSNGFCYNAGKTLNKFFDKVKLPIDSIKTANIRFFLSDYKANQKVSERTLDSIRLTLNSFFSWCVEEDYIQTNPCKPIKRIKYEHKQRTSLNSLELEYMRQACESVRDSAYIETLYSTGCRISEIAGMKLSDIDWTNRTIKVFGKGKKERSVYLNDKAFISLKKYIDSRADACEYVFVSERSPHCSLTINAFQKIYSIILSRTNGKVRKHSPHNMRHTTATLALQSGMPIESISRMLGHANLATTLIYAETSDEKLHSEHRRYVV